jgi:hypothetical protein
MPALDQAEAPKIVVTEFKPLWDSLLTVGKKRGYVGMARGF